MFAMEIFCDTLFISIFSNVLLMYFFFYVDNCEFKAL